MAVNGLVAGWLAGQILGGGGLIRNASSASSAPSSAA